MPIFFLNDSGTFPHPDLAEENGLLAVGGDLSPERILSAYRLGIFPWFSEGDPLLWWFTSPRLVLFPEEFRIPKRLQRYRKKVNITITFDTCFEQVITACAQTRLKRNEDTWLVEEMQQAYSQLHEMGFCHSVECWQNNELVGGLYGLSLDQVFFGESMFSTISNGSKFALVELVAYLKKAQYRLIDCQMKTDLLLSFGAKEITGKEFQNCLLNYIKKTTPDGKWKNDLSIPD
jgi:leucyl/phenylalanyl-tRNA--protein transferase